MKLPRRQFLHLAAGSAALPFLAHVAKAQAYPARPVRMVVGFPAGQAIDIQARLLAQWLQERLGQPFIVENRPGAGGNVGAESAARAVADGYTLLVIAPNNAINVTLYDRPGFDFARDITPVAALTRVFQVMEVNPSLPVKTVAEFISYAKANPGKLNMASAGNGSITHVSGELFKMMTGVHMLHVPYRGSAPAVTDLMGGQVQVMFDNLPSSIEHIRTGKLRALAVTNPIRAEALPDVPTVGDFVPGYVGGGWSGIAAPRNTPTEIIEMLNREINAALADPKIKMRLGQMGSPALPMSADSFRQHVADEIEKWGKVVKFAGVKPE